PRCSQREGPSDSMAGRVGRTQCAREELRLEQDDAQIRRQNHDHRPAREERGSIHQFDRESERGPRRQRQRDLPHSKLRASGGSEKVMRARRLSAVFLCLTAAASVSPAFGQLRQVAYIKASNTEMGDHFGNGGTLEGHGVALSGDGNTLAVGAPYESSSAKDVNGNQNDNSMYSAGAV